jgi:hypothetical protein
LILSFTYRLNLCAENISHSISDFLREDDWRKVNFLLPPISQIFEAQTWIEESDPALDDNSLFLDPDCSWLSEEDRFIADKVKSLSFRWERISKLLPDRSFQQIRKRYLKLYGNTDFQKQEHFTKKRLKKFIL